MMKGESLYSAATTFAITGHGTYTSSSLLVWLSDPPTSEYGAYSAGIYANLSYKLVDFYITASPTFLSSAPTPSLLSDYILQEGWGLIFDEGATLTNITAGTATPTAEITNASAVPEPSTYALLCISLGVVGFVRKKMVKSEG
jgi:hypothetical protein